MPTYGESYFNANAAGVIDPGGYSELQRPTWSPDDTTDDALKAKHRRLWNQFSSQIQGKRVLELGPGYGYMIQDFIEFGHDPANILGVEFSQYAFDNKVVSQMILEDGPGFISNILPNQWDVVIGLRFLPCIINDGTITAMLNSIKTRTDFGIFSIDANESYAGQALIDMQSVYNMKDFSEWQSILDIPNADFRAELVPQEDEYGAFA